MNRQLFSVNGISLMFRKAKRTSSQQDRINTSQGPLVYMLKRSSARKTLSISVDQKGDIQVSAPFYVSKKDIHHFLLEKESWIKTKVEQARSNRAILDQKKFEDGHQFLFLGQKYPLRVIERPTIKQSKIEFNGQCWFVFIPQGCDDILRQEFIKRKLVQWYRQQALEVLGGRIFHYARIIGVKPKKVAVRTQKRMWGCCDYNTQTIHLNWQIILSPMDVVDYVVVHELCHLIVPNHSKKFWDKVAEVMPEYDRHKRWLKINFLDMMLPT